MDQESNKKKVSTFDAQSVTAATVAFFKRWWKLLTIVFVAAAIISAVVSMFIKPMYLSYGIMIPTNSNRLSKAILDYDYSMDFMDYGAERDCEYALQVLTSKQMELAVSKRFNLEQRYNIKPSSPHKQYDIGKKYNRYLTIKRTDFMGIEVAIVDRDPQTAADIVNYIMDKYDTLCHEIHRDRAADAAEVMDAVCATAEDELDSVAAGAKADPWKDYLVRRKCKELAHLQARAVQTNVDKDKQVHYRYVVDRAIPADKKDRPKRALIVAGCSIGALLVCIFGLLIFAPRKEEDGE